MNLIHPCEKMCLAINYRKYFFKGCQRRLFKKEKRLYGAFGCIEVPSRFELL